MTVKELKEKGGYIVCGVMSHVKYGKIPLDPEQKCRIWKCCEEYYWVNDNKIVTKLNDSTKIGMSKV